MKIIGIKNGMSKKGNEFSVISVSTDFSEYDKKSCVCVGQLAESHYIGGSHLPYDYLGQDCELIYSKGYDGKAVVSDIRLI